MVARSFWHSIGLRLLSPIAALALLLAGLIVYVFVAHYLDFERQELARSARNLESAQASFLDKLSQAGKIARLISRLPEVADALDARDQRVLADAVEPFVEFTDVDLLTIYSEQGVVLARGDAPSRFGRADSLSGWLLGQAWSADREIRFTMARVHQSLYLVGAAPIATVNQPVGGYVAAGFAIDETFLTGLKARSNLDLLAEFEGRTVAATVPRGRLASPTLRHQPVPLTNPLGATGFVLSVLADDSAGRAQFRQQLTLVMAVLVISAALVIAGSILVTLRTVTRPLDRITAAMIGLANGDRMAQIPYGERGDEIGAMARAAEVFKRAMAESIELAQARERERLAKERAEAEAAVQAELSRQASAILTASPVPLLLCRGEPARIEIANQAALGFFETGFGDLIGQPVANFLVDPADRDRLDQGLHSDGRSSRFDARWQTLAGTVVWASCRARRIGAAGGTEFLLGLEDITQRKTAEDDLRAAKEQAEAALETLKRTQESLIQAEKMASLSLLVAGVAHEINTPLGISLTAASLLQEKTEILNRTFDGGQMRRTDFNTYLAMSRETTGLMLSNLGRAAELITSFKQVAVDQTSAERRRFDLADYIDEVLISLGPRLKRAGLQVAVACPADIKVDSYPGALSQILTNLVINSLIHAFDDGQAGRLAIDVVLETVEPGRDLVILRFADDGKGIPRANLPRIFEPFFTTRRGSGGTGLGLHVVYNLATQTLGGDIAVVSEEAVGTTFTVRFPRVA